MILHAERRRTAMLQALRAQPGLTGYELARYCHIPSFLVYPQLSRWEDEDVVRAWWSQGITSSKIGRRIDYRRRHYALAGDRTACTCAPTPGGLRLRDDCPNHGWPWR